jgi:hypothetical protein
MIQHGIAIIIDNGFSAQPAHGADLAFGSASSLVLSSYLNQVQWMVSSRPSRPSGSCAGRWAARDKKRVIVEVKKWMSNNKS